MANIKQYGFNLSLLIVIGLGFFGPVLANGPDGDREHGQQVYQQTCVACHGANGKGLVPGTPNFNAEDGVLTKSDTVLIKHVMEGFQSPGSPMAMPAKGGNPSLTEEDIRAVIDYLREAYGHD